MDNAIAMMIIAIIGKTLISALKKLQMENAFATILCAVERIRAAQNSPFKVNALLVDKKLSSQTVWIIKFAIKINAFVQTFNVVNKTSFVKENIVKAQNVQTAEKTSNALLTKDALIKVFASVVRRNVRLEISIALIRILSETVLFATKTKIVKASKFASKTNAFVRLINAPKELFVMNRLRKESVNNVSKTKTVTNLSKIVRTTFVFAILINVI